MVVLRQADRSNCVWMEEKAGGTKGFLLFFFKLNSDFFLIYSPMMSPR